MRKIVYIGNNLVTGNPTTSIQLSGLLRGLGFEVLVYSNKKNKVLRLIDMILGVLKNKDVNLILIDTYSTWNFYYAVCISQLARFYNIKYIPITHGGNLPERIVKSKFLSNLLFKNSVINVCPSRYLKSELDAFQFKTMLIPNAIDINTYIFKSRDLSKIKLLWVRAFDKIYNPLMAVEVLKKIKEQFPLSTLRMVGPDKDGSMEIVKSYVAAHQLNDSVEITGFLSKQEWIEKSEDCSFFINTSNIDNTPVSVIEAMALGLPVISTNVGGMRFLISDEENGVLVEKGAVNDMSNSIINLIKEGNRSGSMALNARKMVETFDVKSVGVQWEKLLKDVL